MKEGNKNKLKFNSYWVYAIIITILLGMSMFGGDNSWQSVSKTNISDFERFLNEGDVEEIIVVNQKLAKVTLSSYGLEKNVLSFFVSGCLNRLPKPSVVVSYADTSQGHHGFIYQATNWIYTGLSAKFKDYAVRGLEHMHHSSIEDSVGRYDENKNINKHELLRKKYG